LAAPSVLFDMKLIAYTTFDYNVQRLVPVPRTRGHLTDWKTKPFVSNLGPMPDSSEPSL
jgi:hypothetical protein